MNDRVSIILPAFNRARFLPKAFDSIERQTYRNWHIVFVDDGSEDETEDIVKSFCLRLGREKITYHKSPNQGAYAARNIGLELATGKYIAFFDSDDLWSAEHLAECVAVLERSPSLSLCCGATIRVSQATGNLIQETNQQRRGQIHPVIGGGEIQRDGSTIAQGSDALESTIRNGFCGNLQGSVFRSSAISHFRFRSQYRNGQDRFLFLELLLAGDPVAFLPKVHVTYQVHESNDSLVADSFTDSGFSYQGKRKRIIGQLIEQYEHFEQDPRLLSNHKVALNDLLAKKHFWDLGYNVHAAEGDHHSAMKHFREGLRRQPLDLSMIKTLILFQLRKIFRNVVST